MECKRCGNCCRNIGTIWVNSKHPLIKALYDSLPDDYFTDYGDCLMLEKVNGIDTCLIHKYLGFEAKPDVCRKHEGDERWGGTPK